MRTVRPAMIHDRDLAEAPVTLIAFSWSFPLKNASKDTVNAAAAETQASDRAAGIVGRFLANQVYVMIFAGPETPEAASIEGRGFLEWLHASLPPETRQRLVVFNRQGTRVYAHSPSGEPILLENPASPGLFIRRYLNENRIEANETLIVGDGVESFDPETILVGVESPAEGGYQEQLLDTLDRIAERVERSMLRMIPRFPYTEPGWVLAEEGYNPARELEIEALLTVSNGYAGTRGTLFERGSPLGPGTLVAGVFDLVPGEAAVPGLVAAPDWIRYRMEMLEDEECGLTAGTLLENRRILDMHHGMMWRELRHQDPDGKITAIRGYRLASQKDRHLLMQSLRLTPVNYSGRIRIETEAELYQTNHKSYLNPYPVRVTVVHDPVKAPGNPAVVNYHYRGGADVAFAASSRLLFGDGEVVFPGISRVENRVAEHWEVEVELGKTYQVDRLISVFTSRDGSKPAARAREHLKRAWAKDAKTYVRNHVEAWKRRWEVSNVRIDGDPDSERALRFACYSLLSAANPEEERVSIGARALTGNSYLGHVFWDTEIFMLPVFTFTAPDVARSLLMYRYHTLPGARLNARKSGYSGAMYAWESADTGEETTPSVMTSATGERIRILTGEQEHHITADVAYAVWQYFIATNDRDFMYGPGAEILVETARFWASRAKLGDDGEYHIDHAIGPDEYHEDIEDNVYTNEMARWNLLRAANLVAEMAAPGAPSPDTALPGVSLKDRWRELSERLSFDPREPGRWREVAEKISRARERNGVIEQFRGYFDLEDVKVSSERQPGGTDFRIFLDVQRLGKTQFIKQADVMMLLYLFWDQYSESTRLRNFDYYEKRTLHGSSLSPAIYSLMAARLGEVEKAYRYYRMAAEVDLRNNMGNASGGVHSAAQGGLWQATVFGFAGMQMGERGLSFDPRLPKQWEGLGFRIIWRGQIVAVDIGGKGIELVNKGWLPVPVRIGETPAVSLEAGQRRKWEWREGNQWKEVS